MVRPKSKALRVKVANVISPTIREPLNSLLPVSGVRYTHVSTVKSGEKKRRLSVNWVNANSTGLTPVSAVISAERCTYGPWDCTGLVGSSPATTSIWISSASGKPSLSVSHPGIGQTMEMASVNGPSAGMGPAAPAKVPLGSARIKSATTGGGPGSAGVKNSGALIANQTASAPGVKTPSPSSSR